MHLLRSTLRRGMLVVVAATLALVAAACTGDAEPRSFVVQVDEDSPIVRIYNAGGELRHTMEIDADRVLLVPTTGFGTRTVILVERPDGEPAMAMMLDAETGQVTEIAPADHVFQGMHQIPGNEWHTTLLIGDKEKMWAAANLATGDVFRPTDPSSISFPHFAADESVVAYVRTDETAWVVDTTNLTEKQIPTNNAAVVTILTPSPDGSRVAWLNADGDSRFAHITDLATGEVVELPDIRFTTWVSDDVLVGITADGHATIDARTGQTRIDLPAGINLHLVSDGRALMGDSTDGLLQVIDLATGEIAEHTIPPNNELVRSLDRNDRFLWGTSGGVNGSVGIMNGWIYEPATGDVVQFDQPIADDAFFHDLHMSFNIDRSIAVAEVDGTLYRIDSDGTVTTVFSGAGSGSAVCPTGDIVVVLDDGATSQLLSADSFDSIATFGSANQAVCLTEAG